MKDFLQLNGKHILVTGSGSGIGRQTAITLSEYGAKLSLIDLFEEKLGETLGMLSGSGHRAYAINLAEIDALEGKLKEIIAEQGAFDGYVQSAGINRDLPINSVKFEKLHDLMLVNFYSFYEIVRIISRKGRYNPGLSIVGISSTASVCGVSAQTAYSASKAAMNGTMRSMAKELGAKEIRVNTVLPGPTNTGMYQDYLNLRAETKQADQVQITSQRNYLGMNMPEDIANAIAFLLSPASRHITGVMLPVDSGYTSC